MAGTRDSLSEIAWHYDAIMEHVDYDRWFMTTTELAGLLPAGFRHLDAACGTGTLLSLLHDVGWDCMGADLSAPMLRAGRKRGLLSPTLAADLRALPFRNAFDYVTCLFDSMNFLLELDDVRAAVVEFAGALREGGLLYFDVVTERMVRDHFDGEAWEETNGRFKTTWESRYDRRSRIVDTTIRINTGAQCLIRERIHALRDVERAVKDAGLGVLAVLDAHTWQRPNRKTVRVDFIAVKGSTKPWRRAFRQAQDHVRGL